MSTVIEQQTRAQERKTELNPLNKDMRLTPQYKTVIQIRTKNRKEDEKQNTDEYN